MIWRTLQEELDENHLEILGREDEYEAFEYMRDYIGSLSKKSKQIFFFDEMPWFDTHRSGFLPAFEWFWNDYASTVHIIVFIVCGSATAWMDRKIANNKGGLLFHRQTCNLYIWGKNRGSYIKMAES